MNRISIPIRKSFLRMLKMNKSAIEISKVLGISTRTVFNWKKIVKEDVEDKFLTEPSKVTVSPTFDTEELKQYMLNNPDNFYKETAKVFGKSVATIHRYGKIFGITRKKFKTTYKESKPELKKSSKKN
jgi:transposase